MTPAEISTLVVAIVAVLTGLASYLKAHTASLKSDVVSARLSRHLASTAEGKPSAVSEQPTAVADTVVDSGIDQH